MEKLISGPIHLAFIGLTSQKWNFDMLKLEKSHSNGHFSGTYSSISVTQGLFLELSVTTTSPVAQTVRNPPALWEDWVRSLGWEDPLEKEWLPTPVFLPGKFHGQRNLAGYCPWGSQRVWVTFTSLQSPLNLIWHIVSEHPLCTSD